MASKTELFNKALARIGERPIQEGQNDTPQARACAIAFPTVLEAVLREHPWNFAIKRVVLSPLVEKPAFGYANYFKIPSDCVRIVQIQTDESKNTPRAFEPHPYATERGKIACDVNLLYVRYVTKDVEIGDFDSLALEYFVIRLAAEITMILTNSLDLKETLRQEARLLLGDAQNIDSTEGYTLPIIEGNWLDVRR